MGDPTDSKATTGLALGIFEALKPTSPDLLYTGLRNENYSSIEIGAQKNN
jgi:hypothetical protein